MATRTLTRLQIETHDPAATAGLGERLGAVARPGDVICVWGELGAGKTVFAKGFGAGLGTPTTIASPSFVLMAEHVGRLPLFHLDLYRLAGAEDVFESGLVDGRQAVGVTLIEWPQRLADALPSTRLDVELDILGETHRRITLRAVGPGPERYLEAARE